MSNYKDFLETSITFSDQLRRGDKVLVEVTVDGSSVLGRKTISVRDGVASVYALFALKELEVLE